MNQDQENAEIDEGSLFYVIKAIGVGEVGRQAIQYMASADVRDVELIALTNDEESERIRAAIGDAEMLLIVSGTSAADAETASVIDGIAKTMNVCTLKLQGGADGALSDAEIRNVVRDIAEALFRANSLGVGIDFGDIRVILDQGGRTATGSAQASGPERGRMAAELAYADCGRPADAAGMFVIISGAHGTLRLNETKLVMSTLRARVSSDAHVIYGLTCDDALGDALRVTLIATGMTSQAQQS